MSLVTSNKLLFISAHFPPCAASGVFRTLGFCRNLKELGWEITILAINDIKEERKDQRLVAEIPSNIKIIRSGYWDIFNLRNYFYRKKNSNSRVSCKKKHNQNNKQRGISKKIKDNLSFLLKTPDSYLGWIPPGIFKILYDNAPIEIILATSPPFSALILGTLLKKKFDVPLIVDLRDPWVFNPFRPVRPKLSKTLDKLLEKWVFRNADAIILNTSEALKLYKKEYPAIVNKFSCIPNGWDSTFPGIYPAAKPDKTKTWIVHVGSLYGKRSVQTFVTVLKDYENIIFSLYGPISDHFLAHRAYSNVILNGIVNHNTAISVQKGADIVLIIGNCTPNSVQIPAKIYEALAISKKIWLIDTQDSPTRKMLMANNIPHLFSENNHRDIRKCCDKIVNGQVPSDNIDIDIIKGLSRTYCTYQLHNLMLSVQNFD